MPQEYRSPSELVLALGDGRFAVAVAGDVASELATTLGNQNRQHVWQGTPGPAPWPAELVRALALVRRLEAIGAGTSAPRHEAGSPSSWLTVKEVAELDGVRETAVRERLAAGAYPGRVVRGRCYLIPLVEVLERGAH
jgi:hypothetical protein